MRRVTTVNNDGSCVVSRWSLLSDIAKHDIRPIILSSRNNEQTSLGKDTGVEGTHLIHDRTNPFGQRFSLIKDNPLYTSDGESSGEDENTSTFNDNFIEAHLPSQPSDVTCSGSSLTPIYCDIIPDNNEIIVHNVELAFKIEHTSKELSAVMECGQKTWGTLKILGDRQNVPIACGITPRAFKRESNTFTRSRTVECLSSVSTDLPIIQGKLIVKLKPVVANKPNIPSKFKVKCVSERKQSEKTTAVQILHEETVKVESTQNLVSEIVVGKQVNLLSTKITRDHQNVIQKSTNLGIQSKKAELNENTEAINDVIDAGMQIRYSTVLSDGFSRN